MFSPLWEGSPSFGVEVKIQRVKGCGGKCRKAGETGVVGTFFRIENRRGYFLIYLSVAG
jgi:hypothetical protein